MHGCAQTTFCMEFVLKHTNKNMDRLTTNAKNRQITRYKNENRFDYKENEMGALKTISFDFMPFESSGINSGSELENAEDARRSKC